MEKNYFFFKFAQPKGRDFDLYSINIDGTGLERITFFEGFDGFPMFSPDGKYSFLLLIEIRRKRRHKSLFSEWNY